MIPEKLWHYTAAKRLKEIVESREIRLTDKLIAKSEKPAVWVSSNPIWEFTATKMAKNNSGLIKQLTKEEMYKLFGLGRIEIVPNEKYISWAKFKHKSRIPADYFFELERAGIDKGANPKDWFARFTSIPIEEWIAIETWNGTAWS